MLQMIDQSQSKVPLSAVIDKLNKKSLDIQKTGSFKKEDALQHSIMSLERATTPEVTTPYMNKEDNRRTPPTLGHQKSSLTRKSNIGVNVNLLSH